MGIPFPEARSHRRAQRLGVPVHNAGSVRYLQRGLSRPGEAESREGRREGEHHQLQDFLLSWLRFPCLYIAPSCHSLRAHSWEETAGRTDGEDAGLCPAEPGWLPAPAQTAACLSTPPPGCTRSLPPPKTPLPASCTCSHSRGSLQHSPCEGHMCKQRPGGPGVLGTPNLCYEVSAGLSYPSFSADSAAPGQGCCWFMPTCNMNLSRENAEAVDPQDCPHRLCLDPKSGSTGSAGRAPGWPCPVCQWQLGLAAHRDGHCPTVPMSTQAAVLLPLQERWAAPQPGAPSQKFCLAEPCRESAPALTSPLAT